MSKTLEAVREFNTVIPTKLEEEGYYLSYVSNGYVEFVTFPEIFIHNSDGESLNLSKKPVKKLKKKIIKELKFIIKQLEDMETE